MGRGDREERPFATVTFHSGFDSNGFRSHMDGKQMGEISQLHQNDIHPQLLARF